MTGSFGLRTAFCRGAGSPIAVAIFLFLATQEISGISLLRNLAEIILLLVALRELSHGIPGWRKLVVNPVYMSALLFVASALFSCAISPMPAVSFDELKTPLLKEMLLVPMVLSLAVLGLVRRGWEEERIARLLLDSLAISGLGQLLWVIFIYGKYLGDFGTFPADPYFHRYKVGAALIVFPFVLLSIRNSSRPWAFLMALTGLGLLVVVVTSNARGAWLGFLASVGYLCLFNRKSLMADFKLDRRLLLLIPGLLLPVIYLLAGTPLAETFLLKIEQGFDTSGRLGHGVWGATVDVILQKPWLGYGYGDEVYSGAYNALAPSRPEWLFRESIGAHNSLLAHWVAAGVFGLVAILALYAGFLLGARRLILRYRSVPGIRNLVHAGVAAMLSLYLIRGQVETVRWDSYGVLMAILMWLFVLNSEIERDPERA